MIAIILNLILYFAYFVFVIVLNTVGILDITFTTATLFFIAVFEIPIFSNIILSRLKKLLEAREEPKQTLPAAAEETEKSHDE